MLRRRPRRPRKPKVYRIPIESYLVLLGVVFALAVAISFLNKPREVSYRPSHEFNVRDPAFVASAHALADPTLVPGNRVDLLVNGDQIFGSMLSAIGEAKKSVNLENYIFWSGTLGSRFRDALASARGRGVQVRLLLDAVGSGVKLRREDIHSLRAAGCDLAFFHPVTPWMLDAVNNRTHRRLLIVDGRIAFTGGAGIADLWMGDADSPVHWRDTQVRVEGPIVARMQSAFQRTWGEVRGEALSGDRFYPRLDPAGPVAAQVIASSNHATSSAIKLLYAVSIASASQRILLANSYFVPDEDSIRLFADAARRGVDVRILVPGKVDDVPATKAAGKRGFGDLLRAGVRIYEYQPTMLHTKTMVVDSLFSTVGSANFDNRSFRLNEELNLTVYDAVFARKLEDTFWADLKRARLYGYPEWAARSIRERLLEWFLTPLRSQL